MDFEKKISENESSAPWKFHGCVIDTKLISARKKVSILIKYLLLFMAKYFSKSSSRFRDLLAGWVGVKVKGEIRD
jgi:hypothetical protein